MLTSGSVVEDENDLDAQDPTESLIAVDGKFVFKKGETFDSYEALLERLEKHQKESFVYYWRRDTRTVERAFTKTSRPLASSLKYYTVHFACVYGGQKFQARGSGKRSRQRVTNRVDCPANIFFRASKCGKLLEVVSVCNLHNHKISEELSALLPQNRKISETLKEEVAQLLKLKVDRKKIIEYVKVKENKNITSKDLFNLSARLKASKDKKNVSNDAITILNRVCENTTDEKIKVICTKELSNLHNQCYSLVDPDQFLEYTLPITEICENKTVQNETEERNQMFNNNSDENIIIIKPKENAEICNKNQILSIDYNNIDKLNNFVDADSDNSICKNEMIEDFIVEDEYEMNNYPNCNNSPIVVLEEYFGKENLNEFITESIESNVEINNDTNNLDFIEYQNIEESNDMEKQHVQENSNKLTDENLQENCTIILYETTTAHIDDSKNHDFTINNEDVSINMFDKKKISDMKKSVWKSRRKINKCNKCGSKTKLLNMQIKYLKAQRDKLLEETKLLKMKRKILNDYYFNDTENFR